MTPQHHLIALVTHRIDDWRRLLHHEAALPVPVLLCDEAGFSERAQQADILLGDTPEGARWLPRLPGIRWFHTTYSGIDELLPVRSRLPGDLVVTNSRDIAGPHIAEYVLAHTLNRTRLVTCFHEHQKRQEWRWQDYRTLQDFNCLVLGTGAIGRCLAERLRPWVRSVQGISRSGSDVDVFDRVAAWPAADTDLGQFDLVVNTLPYTPDTHDLIDSGFLARLNPTVLFINTGRGLSVVEDDLIQWLDAEPKRHAVLDVFREEPLPTDHPFWHHPAVTVTPHVAALSRPEWVLPIFRDNLDRYLAGRSLRNTMSLDRGY